MPVTIRHSDLARFQVRSSTFANVGLPLGVREGVSKAALVVTTAARASIAAGSGGDSALSNVGRGGAKVGARFDVKGTQNATALIRGTGPLHLLDNPTGPHVIVPKGLRKGRSKSSRGAFYNALFGGGSGFGAAKPLRTPYGPRYRVQHPGTRGKRTFFRGVDAARPLVPATVRAEVSRQMVRHFR